MTTLTVNIKDISQIAIIKKILKAFDVEVIEQNNEITNPEIIGRLEKHHKNFQDAAYREKNYTQVDAKNIWADIQ
jgi:predicted ester cyclase